MKQMFVAVLGAVVFAGLTLIVYAENPRATAKLTLNGKNISVEYGKPALNGRKVEDLLGQLPVGAVWRMGADQSTTFKTSGDLKFGDVTVPKGEYSIWARKESDGGWTLVFNKQHWQWGTMHNPKLDFAAVPLKIEQMGADKSEKAEKPAERVEISLENEKGTGEFSVEWGTMELTTTFN